jgi:RES domain-containing protein
MLIFLHATKDATITHYQDFIMQVYRIVKSRARTMDLSGTGSYIAGGRWNFDGTYAVYTGENRSLSLLETLVHTEEGELPSSLFIITIALDDTAPVLTFNPDELPRNWREIENFAIRQMGTQMLKTNQYLALRVPSAVMPFEFNYVLNPAFPGFDQLVKIGSVDLYTPDERLPS